VRRFLDKSRYRKPVYIITGLKTVTGAKAKSHKSRTVGGKFGVDLDATIWSGGIVPVGGGPEIEGKRENIEGTSWKGSSDFVFAFRARKISVRKKTGEVKSDEEYKTGAMLGDEVKEGEVPVLVFSDVDPEAEDEGCEMEELMEDDAVIACAVPKAEDFEEEE
jgi:hypothetical protein